MHRSGYRRLLALLPLFLLLAACGDDDDPVKPEISLWQDVGLPSPTGQSRLLAVDFTGDRGLAMGLNLPDSPGALITNFFFAWQPDGSWPAFDPGEIRPEMVAVDFAVDDDGKIVLSGFQYTNSFPVVLDLRGPEPRYVEQAVYSMTSVECEGSFMVAGGRSDGGGLWTSTAPDQWTFDDLPLVGGNDTGFHDIDIRNGRAVACGYDDAADTMQVILTRTLASDWRKIPPGGPTGATFYSVAQDDDGTIYLGGIDGAGGPSPQAFLSRRTADGTWTDLDLPDAAGLHGIRDILVAADGSLYLACYGEGDHTAANLVHGDPTDLKQEITPFPGGLYQVDQAADGTVYAVGFRRDPGTGDESGVMLVRSP